MNKKQFITTLVVLVIVFFLAQLSQQRHTAVTGKITNQEFEEINKEHLEKLDVQAEEVLTLHPFIVTGEEEPVEEVTEEPTTAFGYALQFVKDFF